MGREIARILPGGQRETKAYNDAGELIAMTDFNGVTTRYDYDRQGRAERIDYANDVDVSMAYSPRGERTSVTDARGESTMQFDARGRVLQSVDADGGIIEYQYDDAGNLIARISPSQSLVYTYDERNRMTQVSRSVDGEAPSTTRYEYDANGNRAAMIGGDGTRTEYGYDARYRLRSLIKRSAAAALLLSMNYTVDASGMRTAVSESDSLGTIRTVQYDYDGAKRLTSEFIDHRDNSRDRNSTWTYDKVGSRLTQTVTEGSGAPETTSYSVDVNDRLSTELRAGQLTAYTYDANGNTATKTSSGQTVTYTYDDANRLIAAASSDSQTSYVYSADGLRVRSTHTPAGGTPTTTWHLQDSAYPYAQVIEQHEGDTKQEKRLTATYTFADELVSQTRYDSAGNPTTSYLQMDGFGSTRWLTDSAGSITDAIDYDAFGNEIGRSGTTEVEHLYRGEAFDPNVGFYYLRARWYGAEQGRFLTQDSFVGFSQDPQSLHKYAFNHNDAVNRVDPGGHFSLIEVTTSQNIQAIVKIYNVGSFAVDLYAGGLAGGARAVAEEIVFGKLSKFRPIAKMSDEVLGLFAKVWSRGVNLKLGLRYNSNHLRHNMEQVFGKLPADHAPHHIVPSTSPAMKKLRDFDIDPNSPSNGVALPKLKDSGSLSAQHSGGHCRKYYDLVERLVSSANTKEDVVNMLALVRVELLSGAALVQGCT